MTPCVCSHPRHWHVQDGLCIDGCTCVQFHPDDGSDIGTTSVDHRADPYLGIYGSDRKWAL